MISYKEQAVISLYKAIFELRHISFQILSMVQHYAMAFAGVWFIASHSEGDFLYFVLF